jgi:putative transposase
MWEVVRGPVAHPMDWEWSSYRHWESGVDGAVEIESPWMFARRMDMAQRLLVEGSVLETHISESRYGAPTVEEDES